MGRSRNNAQDLYKIIPNYAGYEFRNNRKKSDGCLRNAFTEKMNHTHAALEKLNHHFNDAGKQDLVQAISKVQTQLVIVTKNLKDPAYPEAKFFEQEFVPETGVNKVHDYDKAMTEQAQTLFEEVNELNRMQPTEQEFSDYLNYLQDLIEGLTKT